MTNIRVTDLPNEVICNLPAKEAMALVAAVPAFRSSPVLRTGVRHLAIRENLSEVMKSYGLDGPEISPTAITPEAVADQLQSLTELQNIPGDEPFLSDEMKERLTRSINHSQNPRTLSHQNDIDVNAIATDPNAMNHFRVLAKFLSLSGAKKTCTDEMLKTGDVNIQRKFLDQNADWWKKKDPLSMMQTFQMFETGEQADFVQDHFPEWSRLSATQMWYTKQVLQADGATAAFVRDRFPEWSRLNGTQMSYTNQVLQAGGEPAAFVLDNFPKWSRFGSLQMFYFTL